MIVKRNRTKLRDLAPHDRADRATRYFGAISTLLVDLIIVMALAGLGFVAYIQSENAHQLDKGTQILQILQCHLVPGRPCYKSDRANTKKVIDRLDRLILVSLVCDRPPHNRSLKALQRCVLAEFRS